MNMKMLVPMLVLLGYLSQLAQCRAGETASAAPRQPQVLVLLWFDTEDYILPASDDAAKRVAEILTDRGVRGTFKVVGEKARMLEKRGRQDVIAALKKHAIAYHANFHSVHPTPSEYLADCGFLDGVAEFVRREGSGAADVRRIFGVETLACYGQPGSSWASQPIAALKQIGVAPAGIPCYVDDGSHIGLNNQPFWFEGALVVYDMGPNVTRMELHDPAAVEPARQAVTGIADRLRAKGGGLISIYYHPCEWVHRQFWDGVNFSRGANPPREQWKLPPQRPPEETEQAFQRFAGYVDYLRTLPAVRFVTASDLPSLYPDRARSEGVSEAELREIAAKLVLESDRGVDFQVSHGKAFSVADQFELLTGTLSAIIGGSQPHFPLTSHTVFGPDQGPPTVQTGMPAEIPWPAFRAAVLDAHNYLQTEGRVPARIFIGAQALPPADFLTGLASVFLGYCQNGKLPETEGVKIKHGLEMLPARHVAEDTPGLFGGWVIHPAGFRAPKILEVARWQAWTLKPALR
jgi:hypothetical protein